MPQSKYGLGHFFYFKKASITKNRTAYPPINAHQLAFRLIHSFLFLLICTSTAIAADANPSDTSERLYIYDIKFEGANIHIDANYQYILSTFVDYLKKNPEIFIHIRGHVCCRSGKRISRRRARNVFRFLKRQGISKVRMTHAGYSDSIPLVFPERTDDDERRNRRVDFVLSKTQIDSK